MKIRASELKGKKVIDSEGYDLVEVEDFLIEDWTVKQLTIKYGGVFKKRYNLEINEIKSVGDNIILKESLKNLNIPNKVKKHLQTGKKE